jgi:hypothetical protein
MKALITTSKIYGNPVVSSFNLEKRDFADYQKLNWWKLDESLAAKPCRFENSKQAILIAAILLSQTNKHFFVPQNMNEYTQGSFRQAQIPSSYVRSAVDIGTYYVTSKTAPETVSSKKIEAEFNLIADRWETETAIHSSPGGMYLNKDYIAIIAKGVERPEVYVPLILNRLSVRGGDWFFALENIAGENPAKDCEDYENALIAWRDWATQRGFIKESNAVLAA